MTNLTHKEIVIVDDDKDNILRKTSDSVSMEELDGLVPFIDKMLDVAYYGGALGVAAPQLGVSKEIFVLNIDRKLMVFINPTIVASSGKITSYEEGCLSVPGKRYNIRRSRRVTLRYIDRSGNEQIFRPTDKTTNIAIQHEMDHLKGILISDRGKEV